MPRAADVGGVDDDDGDLHLVSDSRQCSRCRASSLAFNCSIQTKTVIVMFFFHSGNWFSLRNNRVLVKTIMIHSVQSSLTWVMVFPCLQLLCNYNRQTKNKHKYEFAIDVKLFYFHRRPVRASCVDMIYVCIKETVSEVRC